MKVFALGGSGTYGRFTAQKLVASEVVSELVIAARNIESARSAAAELGPKATAVQVDIRDEERLASQAEGSDIMVNTIGPDFKVALPALRAAIKARVNYCDLCCHSLTREKAQTLDGPANASGITALMGIGVAGLSNLIMMHAAHQLDHAEEIRCCVFSPIALWGDPKTVLATWERRGRVDASWQLAMRWAAEKTRLYRNQRWIDVNPKEDAIRVRLPLGEEVTAYPVGLTEPITLPIALPSIQSVSSLWSLYPPELNEQFFKMGQRVARGELDESEAAILFYEHLVAQPEQSLTAPKGHESGWELWVEAIGTKQNKRVCYRSWPSSDWYSTAGPLALAVLKILKGDILAKGVLSPESCLDPMPFFAEVAQNAGVEPPDGRLLDESFELLTK